MDFNWDHKTVSKTLIYSSHTAIDMHTDLQIFEKQFNNSTEVYTNVDIHIEKLISDSLNKDNLISIVGEESIKDLDKDIEISSLLNDALVIDPIDGTNNYINDLPNWAISVGFVKNKEFAQGAISIPMMGEMYISDNDIVYSQQSKQQFNTHSTPNLTPYRIKAIASEKHKIYSSSFNVPHTHHRRHSVRSCVYSIAKVISGGYFAYAGAANIWDFAACIGIFRALGLDVFCYHKDSHSLSVLPWKITDEYWINYIYSRFPLIFAPSRAHAMDLL